MYNIENKEIELFKKLSPFLWQLTRSFHVFLSLDVAFASLPVLSIFFPSPPTFFLLAFPTFDVLICSNLGLI